ncbi:MAG TPA: ATP-dependent Clp protease adaptor ClpS [Edaphocola sp.]|nr:ATP-dependent Clp protease adaptor ClpS [Edaphocola sp.]
MNAHLLMPGEIVEEKLNDGCTGALYRLIIWNDDINTFDNVEQALVEICHHSPEQAAQCALLIHFRGKYAVKKGDFEVLRPMCEGLIDRGINATID